MKCMEKAYAKVNLTLQVGSRRPDGYHAVMSVMQRISLWDTVTVERGTGRDTLLCSVPVTENVDDNLCMKAARAFFAETGTKSDGVTITLEKRIPVQAGLGGGSSDAAAVLRALRTEAMVAGSSWMEAVFSTTSRHSSSLAVPLQPRAIRRAAWIPRGVAALPSPSRLAARFRQTA